jgi:hypothetical protein
MLYTWGVDELEEAAIAFVNRFADCEGAHMELPDHDLEVAWQILVHRVAQHNRANA